MIQTTADRSERIYATSEIARRMVRTPASLTVQAACAIAGAAGKFPCDVLVTRGAQLADANSVMELVALGAEPGDTLEVLAEGGLSVDAVRQVSAVIAAGAEART